MKIHYICSEEKIGNMLKYQLGETCMLEQCQEILDDYSAFDAVLIVEPFRIKNQSLSIYMIWKRFLANHSPQTKLIVAGFSDIEHPNYLNLLTLNNEFDVKAWVAVAQSPVEDWGISLNKHGDDYDILNRLKRFFKGHNYESIVDSISKVRQVLNNADLSVKGSVTLKREKEDFKAVWLNQLYKKRPFFRNFYSRWTNYRDYFYCLPFYPELQKQNVEQFIEDLHTIFQGEKDLSPEELAQKEALYKNTEPFNQIGKLSKTFRDIDKKFIDPKIIGRCLLIDDDKYFHQQMKESFLDFSFESVFSFKEAKTLDGSKHFDIILLDLELEPRRYSGIDLIGFLKDLYPDTSLSIVSIHAEREIIQMTLEQGADYFLNKSNFNIEKWTRDFYNLLDKRKYSKTEIILRNEIDQTNEKPIILIVEDEMDWYDKIIELSGAYRFRQANTIVQAKDMLRTGRYDLIILDLFFEVEGNKNPIGIELIPILNTQYPEVPLIVSTIAKSDKDIIRKLNAFKINHILDKHDYDAARWLKTIDYYVEFKQFQERKKAL